MIGWRSLLAALPVAAAASGPLAAQTSPSSQDAVTALFPKGETVCYARRYDSAHMQRNRDQSVTSVRLMRGFQQVRDDENRPDRDGVYAELIVTYRDSGARRFLGGAICRSDQDGGMMCSSDSCDGGSFPLRIEGSGAILLGGSQGRSRFTVSGGCGDGGPDRSLGRSTRDTVFRLTKAPLTDCR